MTLQGNGCAEATPEKPTAPATNTNAPNDPCCKNVFI
jgi:hypothetical protein